jgi:hypothetical protein
MNVNITQELDMSASARRERQRTERRAFNQQSLAEAKARGLASLHNEGWVIQQCAGGWLATMEQR